MASLDPLFAGLERPLNSAQHARGTRVCLMVEIDNYTPLDYNHWVCTKHDIIIHVRLTIYLGEVSMFTIKTLPFRYPPFLDRPN